MPSTQIACSTHPRDEVFEKVDNVLVPGVETRTHLHLARSQSGVQPPHSKVPLWSAPARRSFGFNRRRPQIARRSTGTQKNSRCGQLTTNSEDDAIVKSKCSSSLPRNKASLLPLPWAIRKQSNGINLQPHQELRQHWCPIPHGHSTRSQPALLQRPVPCSFSSQLLSSPPPLANVSRGFLKELPMTGAQG
jgi:hypothetical protein